MAAAHHSDVNAVLRIVGAEDCKRSFEDTDRRDCSVTE